MRTRHAPRDPDGIRRFDHGTDGPVRGQAVECAERRRGQVGWINLVHGPRLRHSDELRGAPGRIRKRRQRVPSRSGHRGSHRGCGRLPAPQRPLLQPGRVAALHCRHRTLRRPRIPHPHPRLRRGWRPPRECPRLRQHGTRLVRRDPHRRGWQPVGGGMLGGEGYDGVHCFAPDGTLIGKIHLPAPCANLCFGGAKKNRLFMTCSQSLFSVYVETVGAQVP